MSRLGQEGTNVAAPVNVLLREPTKPEPGWQEEAEGWLTLNREAGGNPGFYPLTIKAAYVIGIIHDLCASVDVLLRRRDLLLSTYIPAYGVCASAVDLLGRCITGNRLGKGSTNDILTGFRWLVSPAYERVANNAEVFATSRRAYTVETLAAWRHFAAHGQATCKLQLDDMDFEILEALRQRIRDGLETYWNELQRSPDLCDSLARARVLAFRNWPVLKAWLLFEGTPTRRHPSITEIFNRFDWRIDVQT